MNTLEMIGAFLGIPAALIGLAGGWLSLIHRLDERRIAKLPHGKRAVTSLVMERVDTETHTEIEFLFIGDLLKWLIPLCENNGRLQRFEKVGDYYRLTMHFPPGQDLAYRITKSTNKR